MHTVGTPFQTEVCEVLQPLSVPSLVGKWLFITTFLNSQLKVTVNYILLLLIRGIEYFQTLKTIENFQEIIKI
jgi:hypothetical protein